MQYLVGDPPARLPATATITVASLNLHCGIGWRGGEFDVAAAVAGLDAPVICLQEAWLPRAGAAGDAVAAAARRLGAGLYRVPLVSVASLTGLGLAGPGLAESGPGQLCLAVLTTLPVAGYQISGLGRAPADPIPRLAQEICLRLANEAVVRVVNTHLTHRLTSPVQLHRLWRSLRRRPGPTIIAGDLNMPRLLAARLAGYAPAVSGPTWPARRPLLQLDHLLGSREIDPLAGAVLNPVGSDHLPVRATFSVVSAARPGRCAPAAGGS